MANTGDVEGLGRVEEEGFKTGDLMAEREKEINGTLLPREHRPEESENRKHREPLCRHELILG